MRQSLILILFLSFLSDLQSAAGEAIVPEDHAFYVSVIRIQRDSGATSGTIEFTIFSDDLQSGLRDHSPEAVCPISELCTCEDHIEEYIRSCTRLNINGTDCELKANTCEQVGETHKVTYSIESQEEWDSIEIECLLVCLFFSYVHLAVSITINFKSGALSR